MTKYKALMSIVVIAVVAVATVTWSPQLADARWVTQEGGPLKLPATSPAAYLDVAGSDECIALPETLSISVGSFGNDANTVHGRVVLRDTDGTSTPELDVIW